MKRYVLTRVLVLCSLMIPLAGARAQNTGLVASDDPAYKDIEWLSEHGILDQLILGQRPYSRREIARILRVARKRMDGASRGLTSRLSNDARDVIEPVLQRLENRFGDVMDSGDGGISFVPLDMGVLSYMSTDTRRRRLAPLLSSGIEMTIDPLADRRLGLPVAAGRTAALELAHRIEFDDWLAIQARERVNSYKMNDTTPAARSGEILLASARARWRNVALTVGRQQLTWSQAKGNGLFLASDAPALDAVSLASDAPFRLPGFLHFVGRTQGTLFLADLGASAYRSHSRLLGYKVSVQPNPAVELGGAFFDHFGGAGSPWYFNTNALIDFLPMLDIFRKHNYTDSSRQMDVESSKQIGADARVRLDPLGGLLVSGEMLLSDFDVHRLQSIFTWSGASSISITIPSIVTPSVSAQLVAKHMGPLTYTHTQLVNGFTTRGRLLGDELGPDAKSFGGKLSVMLDNSRLDIEGRSAIYSNATYESHYADSARVIFVTRKLSHTVDELRDIAIGSFTVQGTEGLSLTLRAGAERIRNADWIAGARRNDYVAQVEFRIVR